MRPHNVLDDMRRIADTLKRKRLPLEDEKQTQACINQYLHAHGFNAAREVHIAGGIIDFMVDDIGIEVKIKGAGASIVRQIRKYLAEPRLNGLLLVTSKPVDISALTGKPVAVIDMARVWL